MSHLYKMQTCNAVKPRQLKWVTGGHWPRPAPSSRYRRWWLKLNTWNTSGETSRLQSNAWVIPYAAYSLPPLVRSGWGDEAKWRHLAVDKASLPGGSQLMVRWVSGWKTACRISQQTPDGKSENLDIKLKTHSWKFFFIPPKKIKPDLVFQQSFPAALPLLEDFSQLIKTTMMEMKDLILALSAGYH